MDVRGSHVYRNIRVFLISSVPSNRKRKRGEAGALLPSVAYLRLMTITASTTTTAPPAIKPRVTGSIVKPAGPIPMIGS